jgi:hypothetical protein
VDIATIPHPPHRLPILGDVVGVKPRTPVQSILRLVRDLGPISARKLLGTEIVTVGGADLAAELADETRFRKHVGLHLPPLRRIVGMGCSPPKMTNPIGNWRMTSWRRPSPATR